MIGIFQESLDNEDLHHHIVSCEEPTGSDDEWQRPKTIRQVGIERVVNRVIVEWSAGLGSYGMGGYGFFGLKLAATEQHPEEWLVLTLWGASGWLLFDGKWISAHPELWTIQRPLTGNFVGYERWDNLSPKLLGSTIREATIVDNRAVFVLEHTSTTHLLENPIDTHRLPMWIGTQQYPRWHPDESMRDAWIISQTGILE
ncbi:MAG TPA: hypothetical protein VIL85_04645 [Thermomicrobiales bacterium]|jgi:hypothetical protein